MDGGAELISPAPLPSSQISNDQPSASGAVPISSGLILIPDLSISPSMSSPPAGSATTWTSSSEFGFGLTPISSSTLVASLVVTSIFSPQPAVSSDPVISDAIIESSTANVVVETTAALNGAPIVPAPSPLSLPPSPSRMTSSSVIILPSSTTSSLSSVVVPSSAQIPDEQVSASVQPSLDVDVVDGALTSQKHVTVTFTSPVPSSSSSRKPVVTSNSKPSTTSATPVPTISKINSASQAPMSAVSASSSAGNAQADGSKEGTGTKVGQTNLSSFAIIGIVGGILVGFVIAYLVWYKWRRNKTKKTLGSSPTDSVFQPNEKHLDADGRSMRSSFGDDVDPFDDSRILHTAYPSDRYYEDRRYNLRTEYDEWDGQTHLWDERGTHTSHLEHGDDADIEAELAGEPTARAYVPSRSPNPFEVSPVLPFPPVPPLPVASSPIPAEQPRTRSLTKPPTTRPSTKASDPFGFDRSTKASMPVSTDGYDSLYEKYNDSRPGSDYDRRSTLQTPATAALVPWMRQHRRTELEDVPPVPAVPLNQYGAVPSVKAPISHRNQHEANGAETRRAAPRAAMAQTPIGHGQGSGWTGVIPPFR